MVAAAEEAGLPVGPRSRSSRASRFLTDDTCQLPPFLVLMPRVVSSAAMARRVMVRMARAQDDTAQHRAVIAAR